MEILLDVSIDNEMIFDDYNLPLSNHISWKSIYREIKLNSILENDKKIQFDIDDVQKYIILDDDINQYQVSLKKVCCSINGMTFILKDNKVEKLTLRCKILDTENGRILQNIINYGIEIKVNQFIRGKILNFIIQPNWIYFKQKPFH